jgi:threonyl-tRNA synthetase
MIHRAPFGSMERFVAVLLEHTGGRLPLWLAPDQVAVLPVSEKYNDFAKKVCNLLNNCDIRASIDDRNETIGKKIRENELKRMPFQLIVGEKEASSNSVSVRKQGGEDLGAMEVDQFVAYIKAEIEAQLAK